MSAIADEHARAFEETWRISGSEYAGFGGKSRKVIASEITSTEDYNEEGLRQLIRTGELTTLQGDERFPAGTKVSYNGENFRIIESRSEGRACRTYSIESP